MSSKEAEEENMITYLPIYEYISSLKQSQSGQEGFGKY